MQASLRLRNLPLLIRQARAPQPSGALDIFLPLSVLQWQPLVWVALAAATPRRRLWLYSNKRADVMARLQDTACAPAPSAFAHASRSVGPPFSPLAIAARRAAPHPAAWEAAAVPAGQLRRHAVRRGREAPQVARGRCCHTQRPSFSRVAAICVP